MTHTWMHAGGYVPTMGERFFLGILSFLLWVCKALTVFLILDIVLSFCGYTPMAGVFEVCKTRSGEEQRDASKDGCVRVSRGLTTRSLFFFCQ